MKFHQLLHLLVCYRFNTNPFMLLNVLLFRLQTPWIKVNVNGGSTIFLACTLYWELPGCSFSIYAHPYLLSFFWD